MKRKLPTILVLLVMALLGAMHWIDLSYYTDLASGFPLRGTVWMRYAVLLLPLVMAFLGGHTIGPRGISVLRVRSKPLAGLFLAAGLVGVAYGIAASVFAILAFSVAEAIWGLFYVWYGIWMVLVSLQLLVQNAPSPTKSSFPGVLAALPFCALAIYRVMFTPASFYRAGPTLSSFSAICAMLWMGLLLRALYIALPQSRVRWIYFMGVLTFLLATCLELPGAVHAMLFRPGGLPFIRLLESINLGMLGLCAGCLSVAIAGQSDLPAELAPPLAGSQT